jgi:hypothetical protein
MGYHLIKVFINPISTVTCVRMEIEDLETVEGLFLRDETLVGLPPGYLHFLFPDGERVRVGQEIALSFQNQRDMETMAEYEDLNAQMQLLLEIEGKTVSAQDSRQINALVRQSLLSLMDELDTQSLDQVNVYTQALKNSMYTREYTLLRRDEVSSKIDALDSRMSQLSASLSEKGTMIKAPQGGLFSSNPDGLEPLDSLVDSPPTPSQLKEWMNRVPMNNVDMGKMTYSDVYQYVFSISAAQAKKINSTASLRFRMNGRIIAQEIQVVGVSPEQDGQVAVLCQSNRYISRYIQSRFVTADCVFKSYEGLRVPREGLRIDDEGNTYVFCMIFNQVTKKPVKIITQVERENFYLVEYTPTSVKQLLPGDEIITSGTGLYDGKVIEE